MDSASPIRTSSRNAAVGDRGLPGHGDDYQGRATTTRDATSDVQGHSFVNPAPPADFSKPGPSSGGEFVRNHEDADASD